MGRRRKKNDHDNINTDALDKLDPSSSQCVWVIELVNLNNPMRCIIHLYTFEQTIYVRFPVLNAQICGLSISFALEMQ